MFLTGSYDIVSIIILAVALIVSIILHEYAHGITAYLNGDNTAKLNGRLTLNPIKHFDPLGFIMLFLVGFGFAKPVPINPFNFRHQKKGILTVSLAGVTMNLILAFFCSMFILIMVLISTKVSQGAFEFVYVVWLFFVYMVSINLSLLFFNLLPIMPLDGFHVVEAFTHHTNKFCVFMRQNGRFILLSLIGLSILVSMVFEFKPDAPYWISYFDVLGTYIRFFVKHVSNFFMWFWGLIIPV